MTSIRIWLSVVAAHLWLSINLFGQGVFFDFQQVPTGALPGGFLQLANNEVTAFFGANGTTISRNPFTRQNALHTASFTGQIGVQFNVAATEIYFTFDRAIPGPAHTMKIAGHYTANYSVVPPGMFPLSTSADTFTYRPSKPVWGLLIENVDAGFALSSLTIVPVPEPAPAKVLTLGGLLALTCRFLKKRTSEAAA